MAATLPAASNGDRRNICNTVANNQEHSAAETGLAAQPAGETALLITPQAFDESTLPSQAMGGCRRLFSIDQTPLSATMTLRAVGIDAMRATRWLPGRSRSGRTVFSLMRGLIITAIASLGLCGAQAQELLMNTDEDFWKVSYQVITHPERYATLISRRGQVVIKTQANTDYFGSQLFEGDAIITGADASVAMQFGDGTRVVIEPNSTLQIANIGGDVRSGETDTVLRLLRGRVESHVPPGTLQRYRVATLAGAATTEQGRYRVAVSADFSAQLTEVLSGTVALAGAGRVQDLTKNFGARTDIGRPPGAPLPLPTPPDLTALPTDALAFTPLPLAWNTAQTPDGYRVQLAADAQFSDLVYDAVLHEPKVIWPGLPTGNYFVRVRSRAANDLEGVDAMQVVNVVTPGDDPVPVVPVDIAKAAHLPLWLSGSAGSAPPYRLQVARAPLYGETLIGVPNVAAYADLGNKFPSASYYRRIAAADHDGLIDPLSTLWRVDVGEEQIVTK